MLSILFTIASVLIALTAATWGFRWAHKVGAGRLRYVDAAQNRFVPWIAGGLAGLLAAPFMFLPLIGIGTVVSLGLGVGMGFAAASREVRLGSYRIQD